MYLESAIKLEFRVFFEMSTLRDKLSGIPQDPSHHPEGDVFSHTRMVRQSLEKAVSMLRNASDNPSSSLSNLDFNLSGEDINLLRAASWMHDIGKAGSTTLNIGGHHTPYNKDLERYSSWGRWQAIGHEDAENFKPQMRDLKGSPWESMWNKLSPSDKTDLFFLVKHHMRFGVKTAKLLIDENGKYKDVRRIKLLLVLMIMDWLGRGESTNPVESAVDRINWFDEMAKRASKKNKKAKSPAPDNPADFLRLMHGKPMEIIKMAFKGKFGREPFPEEFP